MVSSVPVKMKLRRTKQAKLPRFVLGQKTFDQIGEIASASIVLNIQQGKQADGSAIKRNAPSTALLKRQRRALYRGRVASLIDQKHRFIQPRAGSWRWFAYTDHVNVEPATAELRRLSEYNQKRGYVGWFGVSKKGMSLIRRVIKRRLEEIVKR